MTLVGTNSQEKGMMSVSAGHSENPTVRHMGRVRGGFLAVLATGLLLAGLGAGAATAAPLSSADTTGSAPVPVLMVTASGNTTVGLQVFATVNLSGASNPTGTLTFRLFGPSDGACGAAPVFTSRVAVTGVSVTSDRYWATTAGTYR